MNQFIDFIPEARKINPIFVKCCLVSTYALFRIKSLIYILLFTLSSGVLSGQITRVKGVVKDATTKEPLAFVNMIFQGTNIGSHSDIYGNFDISIHKAVDTVLVSYLGYKPQKVRIQSQRNHHYAAER